MNIHFISAGAGSGKTFHLTKLMSERLANKEVRPEAVIAMTFTRKAASELDERVRQRLIEDGHYVYANSMGQALIGTVNSVCGQLLSRYAFEAGLSPQLEVLSEDVAPVLFGQALEQTMTEGDIRTMNALGKRLGLVEWQKEVKAIVDLARANDIPSSEFTSHAQKSKEALLNHFPNPATENLNKRLKVVVGRAIKNISAGEDSTKKTREYLELLQGASHRLTQNSLPWSDWVRLCNGEPAVRSKPHAEPVQEVAVLYDKHPGLHKDIKEWTKRLFNMAARALATFQTMKAELGLMDFVDQEHQLLKLLDQPEVADSIRQELDLLLVDEFQDTSPIQLALFLKLSELAGECIWVGDIKQAIYGFRGTDPDLMNAVVRALKNAGHSISNLSSSWRSRPKLVEFTNALFTPAFSSYLEKEQVCLEPEREELVDDVPLQFWQLEGSNESKRAAALATGVVNLLKSDSRVVDKETRQPRALRPGDIAILSRMNNKAAGYAAALTACGLGVTLEQPGLLDTPEVHLALACLRRVADPRDSLASAEIIALKTSEPPESWVEDRIEFLANGNHSRQWGIEGELREPALLALEAIREQLEFLSPSEVLDEVLIAADIRRDAKAWGPTISRSKQRLSNLETLRGFATSYEDYCQTRRASATVGGFLLWLYDLAKADLDKKGSASQSDAIQVLTYHGAKGLEWPVVISADLESNIKSSLWGLSLVPDGNEINIHTPLANRWLRYWPWPFEGLKKNIAVAQGVDESIEGQANQIQQVNEAIRLLYVSFTRARDILIIPLQANAKTRPWLESLGADWLAPQDRELELPDGGKVPCVTVELNEPNFDEEIKPVLEQRWFPPFNVSADKLPAYVSPSSKQSLESAAIGKIIEVGPRLILKGSSDSATLGNALHNILAADLIAPKRDDRHTTIAEILNRFGLSLALDADEVVRYISQFYNYLLQEFKPKNIYPEWPVNIALDNGQLMRGWIDLLLETENGYVIIDHKSFPGTKANWHQKAQSYSGQLDAYRLAVIKATGQPVISQWIHFSIGGGMVEIILNEC